MGRTELLEQLRGEIRVIEQSSVRSGFDPHEHEITCVDESGHAPTKEVQQSKSRTGLNAKPNREGRPKTDAFSKVVNLVNAREQSEHSIRERLSREGYAQTDIDDAVERAKGYGFIDDARFAEVLVRSRISQGKGSAGIERELRDHGIDVFSVPGWPHEYPVEYDQELERALDLLAKKPPRSKNLRESAYRKLIGKGYSSSIAASGARIWAERACME